MISVILVVAFYVLCVLGINGLLVWGICWALNAIGIHTIGTWTIEFSWALVILFTIVETILKSIFKKSEVKND
jgi:hypothetical protein